MVLLLVSLTMGLYYHRRDGGLTTEGRGYLPSLLHL